MAVARPSVSMNTVAVPSVVVPFLNVTDPPGRSDPLGADPWSIFAVNVTGVPFSAGDPLVAVHGHAGAVEGLQDPRQELIGDSRVDEQGLGGVAHTRPRHLGVDDQAQCHVQVRGAIDVDVDVADARL